MAVKPKSALKLKISHCISTGNVTFICSKESWSALSWLLFYGF